MDTPITPIGTGVKPPDDPVVDDRKPSPALMTTEQRLELAGVVDDQSVAICHIYDVLKVLERKADERWNNTVTNGDTASLVAMVKDLHRRVNRIESALGKDKVAMLRPTIT